MSWVSTAACYERLNRLVAERLGGNHSARILVSSVDFEEITRLQAAGDWERIGERLAEEAAVLEAAGADFLVLCTNTMHVVAPQIEALCKIPLLHIVDVAARAVAGAGIRRVGLLGTRFTMENDLYPERLAGHGIEVVVPEEGSRVLVDRVIYRELCQGVVSPRSREAFRRVVTELVERGAGGVVSGCTEIGLLLGESDVPVPWFDTTSLHADAAVELALR